MYLLRAFRKTVPKEVLSKILHVHLLRVTLRRYVFKFPRVTTGMSNYFIHLGPQYTTGLPILSVKIKNDIGYVATLLPHAFPSLLRIDISLHVTDCFDMPHLDRFNDSEQALQLATAHWHHSPLFMPSLLLAHMKNIENIEVCILWDKNLHQCLNQGSSTAIIGHAQRLQQLFEDDLKTQVAVKSITSHAIQL